MKENSIEEDIERLKLCSTNQCYICGRYEKEECMLERNRCEQHILSDYKRVLKENEEKNKIINSMIKVMIENSICDYFIKEKCKNYAGENGKTCDECIKQYFENKVKEVK